MARKSSIRIELTTEERSELERRARSQAAPHRTVLRARIVLSLAQGHTMTATAHQVGVRPRIVHKWAKRFVRKRLDGLEDSSRSGRPPRFSPCGGDAPGQVGLRAA